MKVCYPPGLVSTSRSQHTCKMYKKSGQQKLTANGCLNQCHGFHTGVQHTGVRQFQTSVNIYCTSIENVLLFFYLATDRKNQHLLSCDLSMTNCFDLLAKTK